MINKKGFSMQIIIVSIIVLIILMLILNFVVPGLIGAGDEVINLPNSKFLEDISNEKSMPDFFSEQKTHNPMIINEGEIK